MRPRPIAQLQSGFALSAAIASIVLCGESGALGVIVASGLGAAVSGGLAIRYHHLVRQRTRSAHRAKRDRIMTGCVAIGLIAPTVLGVVVLVSAPADWQPPLPSVPAHVAVIAAVAVFAAMLTSSCFDWYLTRPFRDGVIGPPVCQMDEHEDETVLYYAQAIIAHRTVAELVGWGGSAIVLIVALVAVQQSTRDPTWSGIFTYLAPSGAVYLGIGGYLAKRLRYVPQYVQSRSPGLGRWATGEIQREAGDPREIDGFVVDVALGQGLQTLSLGTRKREYVDLRDVAQLTPSNRPLCGEVCERWIPQCERGLLEDESLAATASGKEEAAPPKRPLRRGRLVDEEKAGA